MSERGGKTPNESVILIGQRKETQHFIINSCVSLEPDFFFIFSIL